MTPFEKWWDQQVRERYNTVRPELVSCYRANALRGWNAALEVATVEGSQMRKAVIDYYGDNLPEHLKAFLYERLAVRQNARVTP